MACDKPTYVTYGQDEDRMWREVAECDGPQPCGFRFLISEEGGGPDWYGINSEEMAVYDAAHRKHSD